MSWDDAWHGSFTTTYDEADEADEAWLGRVYYLFELDDAQKRIRSWSPISILIALVAGMYAMYLSVDIHSLLAAIVGYTFLAYMRYQPRLLVVALLFGIVANLVFINFLSSAGHLVLFGIAYFWILHFQTTKFLYWQVQRRCR